MLSSNAISRTPSTAALPPIGGSRVETSQQLHDLLNQVGNITPAHYGIIDFKALHRSKGGDDGLLKAINRRDLVAVTERVESGAEISACFQNQESALHRAAAMGHLPVIEYLLNQGANLFSRDGDGGLPRGSAIEKQEHEATNLLEQWQNSVFDAFSDAAENGEIDKVKVFTKNTLGSLQTASLQSFLGTTASNGHTETLLHLLSEYGFSSDQLVAQLRNLSENKSVARDHPAIQLLASHTLHHVAARGTPEHLWSLFPCDRLLDINATQDGDTALLALVKHVPPGRSQLERVASEKLEALLTFEPDASIRDADGLTAMEIAQQSRLKRICAQLERYTSPK